MEGECAHVLLALAAWPCASFCRVTWSLRMLLAGDWETGLMLLVSVVCGSHSSRGPVPREHSSFPTCREEAQ